MAEMGFRCYRFSLQAAHKNHLSLKASLFYYLQKIVTGFHILAGNCQYIPIIKGIGSGPQGSDAWDKGLQRASEGRLLSLP